MLLCCSKNKVTESEGSITELLVAKLGAETGVHHCLNWEMDDSWLQCFLVTSRIFQIGELGYKCSGNLLKYHQLHKLWLTMFIHHPCWWSYYSCSRRDFLSLFQVSSLVCFPKTEVGLSFLLPQFCSRLCIAYAISSGYTTLGIYIRNRWVVLFNQVAAQWLLVGFMVDLLLLWTRTFCHGTRLTKSSNKDIKLLQVEPFRLIRDATHTGPRKLIYS